MTELLEQHPIGQILPPMSPEEHSSLRNDLVVHGLRVPIVRYEGKILDGWHRYQLCLEEKIEPQFEEYVGPDPFGLVRSLNMSRRHLTLEQKKEVAHHIFHREQGRSDRSIAEEIGLSHPTVAKIRQEVESNGKNYHKEPVEPANGKFYHKDEAIGSNGQNAHKDVVRVEASGRKARGRKPFSPEEKAARAKARAAAKAEAKKQTKPKPLTSARDDTVNMLCDVILSNIGSLPDIVQIIAGYEGVIRQKFTLGQRHEMVLKFAKTLGVSIAE